VVDGAGTFLVAWGVPNGAVAAARVGASGLIDRRPLAISGGQPGTAPVVDFDGTAFGVFWADGRSATAPDLYGARVTPGGALLDGSGVALLATGAPEAPAAVGFDGARHVVLVASGQGALHVSPALAPLEPAPVPTGPPQAALGVATVATIGGTVIAGWTSPAPSPGRLVFAALDAAGRAGAPVLTTRTAPTTLVPTGVVAASDGTGYLVAWTDQNYGPSFAPPAAYAARLDATGTLLDAVAIPLGIPSVTSLAWDGAGYVAGWIDEYGGGWITRLRPDGRPLGAPPVALFPASIDTLLLAAGAGETLAVWGVPTQSTYTGGPVYANRISSSGALLDGAGIVVAPSAVAGFDARAAGRTWLVVMNLLDSISRYSWSGRVVAARVGGGALLDPQPILLGPADGPSFPVAVPATSPPAVASDGTGWLAVWLGATSSTGANPVLAARLGGGGQILDAAPLEIARLVVWFSANGYYPAELGAVHDGLSYLVAWDSGN
jgi:hypothetical protein